MKARFYLKPEINKAGEAPLRVSVFIRGTRMMQGVGFSVDPRKWDPGTQSVKKGYRNRSGHASTEINSRLTKISDHFLAYELTLSEKPTTAQLAAELKKVIYDSEVLLATVHGGKTDPDTLRKKAEAAREADFRQGDPPAYSYVDEYLRMRGREVSWARHTDQMHRTFKNHLGRFNAQAPLSYFDKNGLAAFVDYLRFDLALEDSSVRKLYKNLVSFLNWCQSRGYASLPDVSAYHPVFKIPAKPVVYLTHQELMTLYNYHFPKKGSKIRLRDMSGRLYEKTVRAPAAMERTRDLFCFCAFTSLRYSDMAALRRCDIQDGVLSVVTRKTNTRLQIKLNAYAQAILDKYKRQKFPGDLALPVLSNKKMNYYLKDVCELCGFNSPLHISGFRKGRRYDITVPKYSEISTHCGRKTFICFMLSIGVAPQVVMKFTGHADYKAMKPYIDIAEKAKTEAMDAMEAALRA